MDDFDRRTKSFISNEFYEVRQFNVECGLL